MREAGFSVITAVTVITHNGFALTGPLPQEIIRFNAEEQPAPEGVRKSVCYGRLRILVKPCARIPVFGDGRCIHRCQRRPDSHDLRKDTATTGAHTGCTPWPDRRNGRRI